MEMFTRSCREEFVSATERKWALEDEGMKLLDLISAEFASDPMSVYCFDLRTVEAVKRVSTEYRALIKSGKCSAIPDWI